MAGDEGPFKQELKIIDRLIPRQYHFRGIFLKGSQRT